VEPLIRRAWLVEALNLGFVPRHTMTWTSPQTMQAAGLWIGFGRVLDSLGWVSFRAGQLDQAGLFLSGGRLACRCSLTLAISMQTTEPSGPRHVSQGLSQKPEERLPRLGRAGPARSPARAGGRDAGLSCNAPLRGELRAKAGSRCVAERG